MERLLKDLVIESIPFSEVNGIKQKERRRILILWLKQGAGGMKQNERDKILLDYGFELYSTSSLSNLIDRYEQGNK